MTRKIRKTGTKSALIAGILTAPMLGAPAGAADYMKTPIVPTVSDKQQQQLKTAAPATPVTGQAIFKTATPSESISLNFAKIKTEYKEAGQVDVAGQEQGHTVYRDAKGQFFYLDSATGDMKFLVGGHICCKTTDKVTLLGIDTNGRTIQQNAKGEKFYLDATGNIVDVTVTK